MEKSDFKQLSYQKHSTWFEQYVLDDEKRKHAETWLKEGTVDAWRHDRMYATLEPLLTACPGASWVTIGDGRYGRDAHYIQGRGGKAHATDIADSLLKVGKENGYIQSFSQENAEALSFRDAEFDWAFCKESFHHFPRPMLALYEMLRCVSQGLVLIEPNEVILPQSLVSDLSKRIRKLCLMLKLHRLLRFLPKPKRLGGPDGFEPAGNYIYRLSFREVEKASIALGLAAVAQKGFNDRYKEGVEYEQASPDSQVFTQLKADIANADDLCEAGVVDYDMTTVIIFKNAPSAELRKALEQSGFFIRMLPANPYLSVSTKT
jgi:ubiquinone/menaquinone biosynthesis C-methylase UbiE